MLAASGGISRRSPSNERLMPETSKIAKSPFSARTTMPSSVTLSMWPLSFTRVLPEIRKATMGVFSLTYFLKSSSSSCSVSSIIGRLPLLLVDVDVLRIDYAFVLLLAASFGARSRTSAWSSLRLTLGGRRLVHGFGQLVRGSLQAFARRIHLAQFAAFQRLLGVGHSVLHVASLRARDLVAVLTQHLIDLVHHAVQLVPRLDLIALLLVLFGVSVSFFRHPLHFF